MGAGSYAAGTGFAGADPVAPFSAVVTSSTPQAVMFDIGSRTLVQNADGTMKAVHPVDQEVMLCLGVEAGKVSSVPDLGHRIKRIARAGGPSVVANVQDAVKLALANVLKRKDIQINRIDVDVTTVRGRIVAAVEYLNLRTKQVQTATVK